MITEEERDRLFQQFMGIIYTGMALFAGCVVIGLILGLSAHNRQAHAGTPSQMIQPVIQTLATIESEESAIQAPTPVLLQAVDDRFLIANEVTEITLEDFQIIYTAAEQHDLPWQLLVAAYWKESRCSRNMGHNNILSRLTEQSQIDAYHAICRELDIDAWSMEGGGSGEMGPFQFMPVTWQEHAVDANDDGRKDPWNLQDAVATKIAYLLHLGGSHHEMIAKFNGGASGFEGTQPQYHANAIGEVARKMGFNI